MGFQEAFEMSQIDCCFLKIITVLGLTYVVLTSHPCRQTLTNSQRNRYEESQR